ncbi:DMT family transporter [Conexibacter woesei]|uniref:DMT family transporter n=1 Tax=Conexibacter woesei TaxID=191495 RepID=UPI00041278C6|nr:DMT family transporter [Conexibacter woesei]
MTALLLALASSIAYGAADFLGGFAARGAHVLRVVMVAAPVSLAVELLLWPVIGASFDGGAVAWGAASGVASAAAFALLYKTLAIGPMSVLSPVTALVSAALPVAVGLASGDSLSALAVAGIVLALVAVVVVSGGDAGGVRPSREALVLAFGAGAAIALQLICLDQAPHGSGVAPLIVGRTVSSLIVLTAAFALGAARLGATRPDTRTAAGAGALDSLANFSFLIAARHGDLSIVAVITALYPAATVLLARVLLGERIGRVQLAGLGVAAVAVSLLALG